jgi:gliding motility-associated-like protein
LSFHLGESVELSVASNDPTATLFWLPPAPCENCWELEFEPLESTTLRVKMVSEEGCQASDDVFIEVVRPDSYVFLPNAFSPNGDGRNVVWEAFPTSAVARFTNFQVFSRWGDQVYADSNPGLTIRWDGIARGKRVVSGVYTCLVAYELKSGERKVESFGLTIFW